MGLSRIAEVIAEESAAFSWRVLSFRLLSAPLPVGVGGRLRGLLLRTAGARIGVGTAFNDAPRLIGDGAILPRLVIGRACWFNVGCLFELGAPITIGDHVTVGPETMILTTTHAIGAPEHRCADRQRLAVTIGSGTWIGARVTILPGVTVGTGAVIAAGSLVNRDVAANNLVAGVPARPIRTLRDE